MAGLVDSVAPFEQRVREVGLGDILPKFRELGFTTYANFAFGTSATPNAADEGPFIKDIMTPLAGEVAKYKPAIRRLYFESYTHVTMDLKNKTEGWMSPSRVN